MSLHQQKDGRVLQHQAVRQPHGGAVSLDLGGDGGRKQRLAAVGAPEAQDIAVLPGSAVRVAVIQCQGHGSAGVQRDGIAAVGSRRKAASVQTQLFQPLQTGDTLHGHPDAGAFAAALQRDRLCAAVGRVTGDGAGLPVGERGVDAEGWGGIGDGVCLRQADAAAGLHGDLVVSGAQLRGVEITAAGDGAAVDTDGLHRLLHIALYRHRRKGQRPLCHGQPAEGGVIRRPLDDQQPLSIQIVQGVGAGRLHGAVSRPVLGGDGDGVDAAGQGKRPGSGIGGIVRDRAVDGNGQPQHLRLRLQMADGEGVVGSRHTVAVHDGGGEPRIPLLRLPRLAAGLSAGIPVGHLSTGAAA